jgi:energy-coupling factor transporter ATP-binding protein EcfA2
VSGLIAPPAKPELITQITNLKYLVGEETLLGPLTLSLKKSTRVLLQGASGAGKTTLCRILGGRLPSDQAKLADLGAIDDYYTGTVSPKVKLPLCGFLGASPKSQLVALQVSDLFAQVSEATRRRAFESVGLSTEEFLSRDPLTLSSGEAARTLLATMIAFQEPLVVLDGPWGLVDADSRRALIENFYSSLSDRAVVETDGIFTPVEVPTITEKIVLSEATHTTRFLEDLQQATLSLRPERSATPEYELSLSGSLRIVEQQTDLTVSVPYLKLPQSRITWLSGANGTGKTTLARCLAGLPLNAGRIEDKIRLFEIRSSGEQRVRSSYINPRWPLSNASIWEALQRLWKLQRAPKFEESSGGLFSRDSLWTKSPVVAVLGSTLYQLCLNRSLVMIDEPFSTAQRGELEVALEILRRWAVHFGVSIVIMTHLWNPPVLSSEQHFVLSSSVPRTPPGAPKSSLLRPI